MQESTQRTLSELLTLSKWACHPVKVAQINERLCNNLQAGQVDDVGTGTKLKVKKPKDYSQLFQEQVINPFSLELNSWAKWRKWIPSMFSKVWYKIFLRWHIELGIKQEKKITWWETYFPLNSIFSHIHTHKKMGQRAVSRSKSLPIIAVRTEQHFGFILFIFSQIFCKFLST